MILFHILFLQSIITALSFSTCGRYIASGSGGGQILIWDISQGSLVAEFLSHSASIHSLAFSRDGTTLSSGKFKKNTILEELFTNFQ